MVDQTFEWYKGFKERRDDVENDKLSGRSVTSKCNSNVQKLTKMVLKDRRLSIRVITEHVNNNNETVRQIFH